MTIDTARCETCNGEGNILVRGKKFTVERKPCPDCTEPAPSAGVSQAEKLADAARSLCSVHGSDPVAYVAARLADVERYYGESQLREITLKKRIAELSRRLEQAEAVRSDDAFGGALSDELYKKRIAELEAALQGLIWRADTVIARTHGGTGLAAQLDVERASALLPKESGHG